MKDQTIIAKLNGAEVGRETLSVAETFQEWVNDKRWTDEKKKSWINYGFRVDRQKDLREGGMSPEDRKAHRAQIARDNLALELGYTSFEEMKADVKRMKEASV